MIVLALSSGERCTTRIVPMGSLEREEGSLRYSDLEKSEERKRLMGVSKERSVVAGRLQTECDCRGRTPGQVKGEKREQ